MPRGVSAGLGSIAAERWPTAFAGWTFKTQSSTSAVVSIAGAIVTWIG
jgi:hypothetical protein